MRKSFPGYFPLDASDIKVLWDSALITVDANILLNLYRYSDQTKAEFIKILHIISDRLWLSHQAAQEYFDNRLGVIAQQEKAYENAIKVIQTL